MRRREETWAGKKVMLFFILLTFEAGMGVDLSCRERGFKSHTEHGYMYPF
jgi:hypothetical protein